MNHHTKQNRNQHTKRATVLGRVAGALVAVIVVVAGTAAAAAAEPVIPEVETDGTALDIAEHVHQRHLALALDRAARPEAHGATWTG